MGSAIVQIDARRESNACDEVISLLQALVAGQIPYAIFDTLGNLGKRLSRLDTLLSPLSDLTMDFRSLPILAQEVTVHPVEVPLLLVCCPLRILVSVLDNLTLGIYATWEQLGDQDAWRRGLDCGTACAGFLFLSWFPFLLLRNCELLDR